MTPTQSFDRRTAVMVGIALMIATYLAFSLRTLMDPLDPGDLFSLKRFAVAMVGTAMFGMVVHGAAGFPLTRLREHVSVLAVRALAALALVLATRVAWDMLVTGQTPGMLADNLRWIIAWSGYFFAALFAYFAILTARFAKQRSVSAFASREDAVKWLVGEVSAWPAAERAAVAELIAAREAYDDADPVAVEIGR